MCVSRALDFVDAIAVDRIFLVQAYFSTSVLNKKKKKIAVRAFDTKQLAYCIHDGSAGDSKSCNRFHTQQ